MNWIQAAHMEDVAVRLRHVWTLVAFGVVFSLGAVNFYQYNNVRKLEFFMECERERSRINDDQLRENTIRMIADLRDQNIENARSQGRLDGIISAINNLKLSEDNEYNKIWHAGYYNGTETHKQLVDAAYENGYHKATEDGACTAKADAKKAAEAKNKPEVAPQKKPENLDMTTQK